MGLIRAAFSAGKSVIADQWKEYFAVPEMTGDQLIVKGRKQTKGNNKGGDEIISNGSAIAIGEGQVALIVEDGKIVEFCAEPGRFIWDRSSEPSMLCGDFFKGLADSFKKMGERFTFGGDRAKDQRVYYVNTKEIMENKFGTTTPMVYDDPYYKTVLYIRYFGQYSFRITDPIIFFTSVVGSVKECYTKDMLLSMCRDEFMTALDTALSRLSTDGIKFSQIPTRQRDIATYMSETLDEEWRIRRGMEVVSVAIAKVTPDEKSRDRIEQFDTNVMHSNTGAMAGGLAYAQMQAMQKAASNPNGAMNGFMGIGMMNGFMGNASQSQGSLLDVSAKLEAEKKNATKTPNNSWKCSCGNVNSGKFCANCGSKQPQSGYDCKCGYHSNDPFKFCPNCGTKMAQNGYDCKCGYHSDSPFKFCPDCGAKY